jgi:hypothetical protein
VSAPKEPPWLFRLMGLAMLAGILIIVPIMIWLLFFRPYP